MDHQFSNFAKREQIIAMIGAPNIKMRVTQSISISLSRPTVCKKGNPFHVSNTKNPAIVRTELRPYNTTGIAKRVPTAFSHVGVPPLTPNSATKSINKKRITRKLNTNS